MGRPEPLSREWVLAAPDRAGRCARSRARIDSLMPAWLEQSAAWALRQGRRVLHQATDDPAQAVRAWAGRLGSLQLPLAGWVTVTGLALANWLTDAAVLAVSIHAAGAAVPWHILLLSYSSGVAAQSLTVTPGGLGVAEGTLGLTLVAAGLRPGPALAAVLLYRLVSFWLAAGAGWLVFLWLRRHRFPEDAPPARQFRRPRPVPCGCRGGGSS